MAPLIRIGGDGVAARCCLRLLSGENFRLHWDRTQRTTPPAIMIGEGTQRLLADVFGQVDLFIGTQRIRKRIVRWGGNAEPVVVPHSAAVISEGALLERFGTPLTSDAASGTPGDWNVLTTYPQFPGTIQQNFGSRLATVSSVRLTAQAKTDACWIESLDNGWLFLLPAGDGAGWLFAVGSEPELLSGSRLVAQQISGAIVESGTFPCHPRITDTVVGPGWLVCGPGAAAFDPLCGDGCGYAVREAILACAVIRAVVAGSDPDSAAAHYRTRLIAGVQRHLETCRQFYVTGGGGDWWRSQVESIDQGVRWCHNQLAGAGPFHFRLNGFTLEPVAR